MPTFAVPDRFVPPFAMLQAMQPKEYSALRDGLARARPSLSFPAMASSVAVGSGLDTHYVEALIEGLTELLAAGRAHDLSVRDSAIQVARALETQDNESKVSGLANRITELLHCSPIQLLGKALAPIIHGWGFGG